MGRTLIEVRFKEFHTTRSGELIGKGDFYIQVDGAGQTWRHPPQGTIQLGSNETHRPDQETLLLTTVLDRDGAQEFEVRVLEKDLSRDDLFLHAKIILDGADPGGLRRLKGIKDRCHLDLEITPIPEG